MLNLYYNDKQEPFIFIRIPKIAGASLGTALSPWRSVATGAHLTAKQLRNDDPTGYDQCISFTFVRNPWDKFVSWYSWQIKGSVASSHVSFEEYIQHLLINKSITQDYHTPKQLHYLVDSTNSMVSPANDGCVDGYNPFENYMENKMLVDHIFKYENIANEWAKCCELIGITHKPIPWEHKSQHKHYTEYYTDETRKIISDFYKDDIERLGYEFGE